MPTTVNSIRRRHEKTKFTPAEVLTALTAVGGMSPVEMLAAGYVNIPAVNDDQTRAASNIDTLHRLHRVLGLDEERDTLAGAIV